MEGLEVRDSFADHRVFQALLRHRTDERRREAEMWAERERVRHEQTRQAHTEEARRENLFATADAWDRAGRIRKLIAEIESRATADNGPVATEMRPWAAFPHKTGK